MNVAKLPKKYQKPPPPQEQELPGSQQEMRPHPLDEDTDRKPSGKLMDKVAIVTGGDSGIGRSVALLFAREGADICIVYLNEDEDARNTAARIEQSGRRAILCAGDIGDPEFCVQCVEQTIENFGKIDIVVNNAAEQDEISGVEDLTPEKVERTFKTNIFGCFYLTKAALPHLKEGASIINTTSVQAYDPSYELMDYACTKAAILNFTRSLAKQLAPKKIRVNAVAPGPIWTPLIPASFPAEHLKDFGKKTLFKRPGQPAEVAPSYLFLAALSESSYITGEVIHVNGGQAMPG
ncbi:MAG TPA: SDR family oxidoreductase [Verrucomicrobiae bacterium]|nr:SDR family oxidoreductase [Verrucomicrobiae bacterium]